ncbi:MAG: hypothetical protein U0U70_10300 [Chitinophagaceae bacterium]
MKKIMTLLGFLFLALWIAGLFWKSTVSIHIALIVSLLFFMKSVMIGTETAARRSE